ncbi:MAG: ABC transporter ATP-binding protein [Mobilicoccus sp.]|nr:ABC transporter ATP-binding protein [Mobilicoccus sp.]
MRYRLPRLAVATVVLVGVVHAAAFVAFVLLAWSVLDVLIPDQVGTTAQEAYAEALWMTLGLVGLGLLLGVVRALEFTIAEKAGYEVVRRLRMDMYEHLTRMTPEHLRHRARGGLLLRLTGDLTMLRMWLSRGVLQGIVAVIVLVSGLGVLLVLNVWMGIVLIGSYALFTAISVRQGRPLREATRRMRRRRSLVIGNIDEQINSLAVVQTSGRVDGEFSRLSRQNDSLTRALCTVADVRGRLRGIAAAGSYVAAAGVLAMGIVEIHRGAATVPTVLAGVLIARFLARPVRTLGFAHDHWHRGQVSRTKIEEFLRSAARPVDSGSEPLRIRRGDVEFRGVSVEGEIEDFTAAIPFRTIVGVTGPAGSGASSIVALLARLVEPSSGTILIDGEPLERTDWHTSGRRIGVVSPDLPLLRGSLRRNLTYRAHRAEPEEIQRVMFLLGLDDVLPAGSAAGVRSWLTEGGANISPRDRQLVKLGRALIGNPRLLVLDQPTEHLDAESAERVRTALSRYQGTVILVSSDPDDLALADVVWHMADGRLTERLDGADHQARLWAAEHRGGVTCRPPVPVG